jgi:cysteinyl-tRNA synthetase
LQFSFDAVIQAEHAYQKLINRIVELIEDQNRTASASEDIEQYQTHKHVWIQRLLTDFNDDLNTAGALATIQTALKDVELGLELKLELVTFADQVFGLKLMEVAEIRIEKEAEARVDTPTQVTTLAEERLVARRAKDWTRADELKTEIQSYGYDIVDTTDSFKLIKNHTA